MKCRSRSLLVGFLLLVGIVGLSVVATGNVAAQQVDVAASDLDGSGTQADPYVITNTSELQAMEDDLDASYRLSNDIDANKTSEYNFIPIGTLNSPFGGSLDGDGNSINNLTIESSKVYVGLFGYIGGSGEVTNLSLKNVDITGIIVNQDTVRDSIIGGIAGSNQGSISRSYVIGNITATNIDDDSNDFAIGTLAGGNGGSVSSSYAVGTLSATGEWGDIGGLVGRNFAGEISSSYASSDIDANTVLTGPIREGSHGSVINSSGLSTSQMTGQSAKSNMSYLDFDNVWKTQPNDYPELATFSDGADASSDADTHVSSFDTTTVAGTNTALDFELNYTGSKETAHVLDLTLPNGWTVENQSTAEAEWKPSEKQWLWQTLSPDQTVTPSITLGIPSNTSGTHRIEGTVYTTKDGTQQAVANTTATVTVENRSVILSPADLSVPNGTTSQLVVNATQDDGTLETVTNSAEYTVSDQSIATVNATGSVTAKQTGTTTLTASYAGASNTTTLTVTDAVPESLTTTVGNQTLANGSETILTTTAQLTNGTTAEVTTDTTYSSNDSSVITVDEQNATLAAESTGTTSVVAVYEVNGTTARDTVSVTVDPAALDEAIDANNDGQIGDTEILTAIDYWQTDATVPYTADERIDALEILDLIYKWRYNLSV